MESYGFGSQISLGNQSNRNILEANKEIRAQNKDLITRHQNDLVKARAQVDKLDTDEGKTIAEAVGGQIASKGKDIQVLPRVAGALSDVGGATLGATEKYVIGGLDAGMDAINRQVPKLFGQTPMDTGEASSFSNILKSDTELAKGGDLGASLRLANAENRGAGIRELGDFLKSNVTAGEDVAKKLGSVSKIGLASTGLSVGLGVMDAVDDIKSGKIQGKNTAERIGNVAGMVSGGLEGLGTALDLTGVGAPVGVALNLLGGIAGLVGGAEELYGESEEKKQAKQQVQAVQQQQPTQQKLQGLQDIESTGAVVKSN